MRYPRTLPGLAEAPEPGTEGWDDLSALEEPQKRGLAALAKPFCSSQPQSAHRANQHQSKMRYFLKVAKHRGQQRLSQAAWLLCLTSQ